MVFFCFIVYILYRFYLKNVEAEHSLPNMVMNVLFIAQTHIVIENSF